MDGAIRDQIIGYANISYQYGRVFGARNGIVYDHGEAQKILAPCGDRLLLDWYIQGAMNIYGRKNVYVIYRLERRGGLFVRNVDYSKFSFRMLRGKEGGMVNFSKVGPRKTISPITKSRNGKKRLFRNTMVKTPPIETVARTTLKKLICQHNIPSWLIFIYTEDEFSEVRINIGGIVMRSSFAANTTERAKMHLGISFS